MKSENMGKAIKPNYKVKISKLAVEFSPTSSTKSFIKHEHAGEVGVYLGDLVLGGERYATIHLDNGRQVVILKRWIEFI